MIMTSLAPTSLWAIFPSGDTLDLVMPGMFRVVAGGRTRGVEEPEFCLMGRLLTKLAIAPVIFVAGIMHRRLMTDLSHPMLALKESAIEQQSLRRERNLHAGTAWSSGWSTGHGRIAQSRTDTFGGTHCSSMQSPAQGRCGWRSSGNVKQVVVIVREPWNSEFTLTAGRGSISDRIERRAGGGGHRGGQAIAHDSLNNVTVLALTSDWG